MNQFARKVVKLAVVTSAMTSMTGCATILGGGSSQAVSLASEPAGARFIVKSSSGLQAAAGNAPQGIRSPGQNSAPVTPPPPVTCMPAALPGLSNVPCVPSALPAGLCGGVVSFGP